MIDPIWINEKDVLEIHDRLLRLYGGASGVRDVNLLRSASARPLQHFGYAANSIIIDLATTLTVANCPRQTTPFNTRANAAACRINLNSAGYVSSIVASPVQT